MTTVNNTQSTTSNSKGETMNKEPIMTVESASLQQSASDVELIQPDALNDRKETNKDVSKDSSFKQTMNTWDLLQMEHKEKYGEELEDLLELHQIKYNQKMFADIPVRKPFSRDEEYVTKAEHDKTFIKSTHLRKDKSFSEENKTMNDVKRWNARHKGEPVLTFEEYEVKLYELNKSVREGKIGLLKIMDSASLNLTTIHYNGLWKVLNYDKSTKSKIEKILDCDHVYEKLDVLPDSWGALYELTRLDKWQFEKEFERHGFLKPKVSLSNSKKFDFVVDRATINQYMTVSTIRDRVNEILGKKTKSPYSFHNGIYWFCGFKDEDLLDEFENEWVKKLDEFSRKYDLTLKVILEKNPDAKDSPYTEESPFKNPALKSKKIWANGRSSWKNMKELWFGNQDADEVDGDEQNANDYNANR